MLLCIIIMVIQTAMFLIFYIILNEMISRAYNFMRIGRLTQLFALYRLVGLALNATLLVITIYRLKRAKVQSTDSGHLNVNHASMLLAFLFLQMLVAFYNIAWPMSNLALGQELARDILNFLLSIMYFVMIANFITDFTLTTKIDGERV